MKESIADLERLDWGCDRAIVLSKILIQLVLLRLYGRWFPPINSDIKSKKYTQSIYLVSNLQQ